MTQSIEGKVALHFSPSTKEGGKFMTTRNICTYLLKAYTTDENDKDVELNDKLLESELKKAGFKRKTKRNKKIYEKGYYVKERYDLKKFIQSKKIHKNLKKSVNLFRYWTTYIETYTRKRERLNELIHELNQKPSKIQTRRSVEEQAQNSTNILLSKQIDMFNDKNKKQSPVVRRFFEKFKENKKIKKDVFLSLGDFQCFKSETMNDIFDDIKEDVVREKHETKRGETVTEGTFYNIVKWLTSEIKPLKSKDAIKKEIKEIKDEIKKIEALEFSSESVKKDHTNFVAAEMGFLIEVQAEGNNEPHIKYYHYPITFTNKNTFSIYDLHNEEFNYCYGQIKLCYSNYIVEDVILKHIGTKRKRADPTKDNHSENALFFVFQQRSFQERMINKLIKDLKKEKLKLTKLENLILEIHSELDICRECFKKAEYFINWKKENGKLVENKQGHHLLEYFRKTFFNMLKNDKVLDEKLVIENLVLKALITYSYDEKCDNTSTVLDPGFIRLDVNEAKLLDSTQIPAQLLSKYSIITSGGVAKVHNNYSLAYNKAVEPARIHAKEKIQEAWLEYNELKWIELINWCGL